MKFGLRCTKEEANGTTTIRRDGKRHRVDGPAYWGLGDPPRWYYEGKLHRDNGPAYEEQNGYSIWYKHGVLHRTDGPARIYENGQVEYWLDGKRYSTINEYEQEIQRRKTTGE